jgi:hypothetical protein
VNLAHDEIAVYRRTRDVQLRCSRLRSNENLFVEAAVEGQLLPTLAPEDGARGAPILFEA